MPPAHASTLGARAYGRWEPHRCSRNPFIYFTLAEALQDGLLREHRRKTSGCCAVIATLGPSCRDVETLVAMMEAGMTAARVDLTVCCQKQHVFHAGERLLMNAALDNDRACCISPFWSPTTLIHWGSVVPFQEQHGNDSSQASGIVNVKRMAQCWRCLCTSTSYR